jgi:hypothetical protein
VLQQTKWHSSACSLLLLPALLCSCMLGPQNKQLQHVNTVCLNSIQQLSKSEGAMTLGA